jgi:hypothetical protein
MFFQYRSITLKAYFVYVILFIVAFVPFIYLLLLLYNLCASVISNDVLYSVFVLIYLVPHSHLQCPFLLICFIISFLGWDI